MVDLEAGIVTGAALGLGAAAVITMGEGSGFWEDRPVGISTEGLGREWYWLKRH